MSLALQSRITFKFPRNEILAVHKIFGALRQASKVMRRETHIMAYRLIQQELESKELLKQWRKSGMKLIQNKKGHSEQYQFYGLKIKCHKMERSEDHLSVDRNNVIGPLVQEPSE